MNILPRGFQRILFVLFFIIMACANKGKVYAASPVNVPKSMETEDNLFHLTLEELAQIRVTSVGTLSELETNKLPFSYQLITAEDIASTPHRNLYDILATYVPGVMTMHHGTSERLGIRGIISDRNYKLLLLVNGRNVTDKARQGIITHFDNWDTNDIDSIEVISGPGAVTYGPGAIAGVISITTKTSANTEGTRVGAIAHPTYNGSGVFVEHGYKNEEAGFGLYAYMSYVSTEGDKDPNFYEPNPDRNSQYVGQSIGDDPSIPPAEHFRADTFDEPQIKFHLDMNFGDNWRWWTRYSDSGVGFNGSSTKLEYADGVSDNNGENLESFITTLTYKLELSEGAELNTMLSYDEHSYTRGHKKIVEYNLEDPRQRSFGYTEKEFFLQSIYSAKAFEDKLSYAFGAEVSYESLTAPFGEGQETLFLNDDFDLISGPDSVYSTDPEKDSTLYVGDGIEYGMYTLLGEVNYDINDTYTLMVAARYDFHDYTDSLLSPRIALVADYDKDIYKFILQSSARRTSTPILYAADKLGLEADPEKVTSMEFLYSRTQSDALRFDLSVFYSDIEIIGYGDSETVSIGDLQLWGTTLKLNYQTDDMNISLGHSYTKQDDFELGEGYATKQGISYSDYNYDNSGLSKQDSGGDDINNWSNHITKAAINYEIEKWTFHADVQVYWGYPGSEDELAVFDKAYASLFAGDDYANLSVEDQAIKDEDFADYQTIKENIKSKDAYGINPIVNLSVSRTFGVNDDYDIWLGVRNIFGDYIQQSYSTGSNQRYPNRMRWMEDPLSTHLRVTARF